MREPRFDALFDAGSAWLDAEAEGTAAIDTLGIVGHEAAKFTARTEAIGRAIIRERIGHFRPRLVVSGDCPLGGIDVWTEEECAKLGQLFQPFPPKTNDWENGFKPRNLQIAASDHVVNIVVSELPAMYRGRRFNGCYHCDKREPRNPPHVKSGGCWTAWKCKSREWRII